jgi:hypothetical protein
MERLHQASVTGHYLDPCEWLIAFLKNTMGISPLNEVPLNLFGVGELFSNEGIWAELNSYLTQHLKFPHLRAVNIHLETKATLMGGISDNKLCQRLPCITTDMHVFDMTIFFFFFFLDHHFIS